MIVGSFPVSRRCAENLLQLLGGLFAGGPLNTVDLRLAVTGLGIDGKLNFSHNRSFRI